MKSFSLLLFVLLAGLAHAQATPEQARADISKTYDFEPAKLSFDEQAKRAPELGALWQRYDKDPAPYRDALRAALRSEGAREMLYCDGGMLLLHKSPEKEDQDLGLRSIAKCTLSEIQHTPYFYTLHALASRGVDTLELQLRILDRPTYAAVIVSQGSTLAQDYAFLYPLLVQEETSYVGRLVRRAREERDDTAQKTILLALWYAATPEAEAALRSMAKSAATPTLREGAQRLLERTNTIRNWSAKDPDLRKLMAAVRLDKPGDAAELRAKRRARMRSISIEALQDLEVYTALIYRTMKRGGP